MGDTLTKVHNHELVEGAGSPQTSPKMQSRNNSGAKPGSLSEPENGERPNGSVGTEENGGVSRRAQNLQPTTLLENAHHTPEATMR